MQKIISIIIFLILSLSAFSQDGIPERPNPPRLVNDFAGVLSEPQRRTLEQKLVAFDDSTGTQIAVVTVNDLAGYDRADFTFTLMNKWQVGRAGIDNGVVIMIKPTGGEGQRHAFIAPGYGLEGIIPDATARRIVDNEMIPYFKNNDYFSALNNATDILMGLAAQEFSAADYDGRAAQEHNPLLNFLPLVFILLFYFVINKAQTRNSTLGHSTSLWTLLMLMNASGRSHSGSWGNFSGGGGSFGGGGFGGFGGGRSGGGGAGGSW
jgi:uncharacterized protein